MSHMKLTKPQILILESISLVPMTIADLANETRLSNSYVRAQIKILEATGKLERVDERQPFMYRVPTESPFLRYRDKVAKYRDILGNDSKTDNSFVTLIRKAPKDQWPGLADEMRAIVETIDYLETQGRLVDTLAGVL